MLPCLRCLQILILAARQGPVAGVPLCPRELVHIACSTSSCVSDKLGLAQALYVLARPCVQAATQVLCTLARSGLQLQEAQTGNKHWAQHAHCISEGLGDALKSSKACARGPTLYP